MITDTAQVSASLPLVPFGTRPGPGNMLTLFFAPLSGVPVGVSQGTSSGGVSWFLWVLPGTQAQIDFSVTVQQNPVPIDIVWEYLSAEGWVDASANDTTNRFLAAGTVVLNIGPPAVAGEVNGKQGYWVRARLASGNYGVPLDYVPVEPVTPSLGYTIRPGTGNVSPPVLTGLSIDYAAASFGRPPSVITQNGFLFADETTSNRFTPFVSVTDLDPFVQADLEPAFHLGFDTAFPEQPVNLYVEAAPRAFSGRIVRETALAPSLLDRLPQLRWEYFNGFAWSPLPVVDGTNNLTESGELGFETPLDIAPLARFDSVPRYWIRARSSTNDPLVTQRLDGVFLNTTTAIQAVTVAREILGSSNGRAGQSFRLARSPVLPGQQVTVREPEPPSGEEAVQVVAEEGADAIRQIVNPITGQTETWVRWHEVNNFLASAPYSRHYTLDHTTGTLTFGALIPPVGSQNIVLTYRSGGGAGGNLPAGAIAQVTSTLPLVAAVANPTAADGGADPETVAMVEDRGPQVIKHRGHAVAAGDIEWLAREAAGPRVARAKCVPNVNQELVFEPGWVTLLIVPNGTDPRPSPDSQLIREVESYLLARAFIGLAQPTPAKINVIGPGYIRVAVAAEVVPVDLAQAQPVKQRVAEALAAYFHPLTGGDSGTGWPFGQPVYASKVARLIENVPGVDHVAALQLIPNIVQHRLAFDLGGGAASAGLTESTTIATKHRLKSARLADATDWPLGRILIKGFKEGDHIAKVIDVVVKSVSGTTVTVGLIDATGTQHNAFTDAAGMPRGSIVMTFDGLQRTPLTVGILPNQEVSSIILESELDIEQDDVLTLVFPFAMTVLAVALESTELTVVGSTIDIGPFSGGAVPAGTQVSHGTRMTPLVQGIDAGATHISVADPGFASSLKAGDQILLRLATAITLTVIGMAASTIDIAPIGTDVRVPAGSLVTNANGTRTSPITQTIDSGVVVQQVNVADQDFASSLSFGDTVLLLTPSLRLDIESYEARLPFDKDSLIATLDNGVRLPLLQTVPAGQSVTAIRLSDFAAGDLVDHPPDASGLAIKTVEPASDTVAMDDNFLVYSGTHRIAMVEV
jgi:hypothetical protein